jgi:SNF2 family DNA or RNA helicase
MSDIATEVAIDIAGNRVVLDCASSPSLTSASHRLFFTSIIGFSPVDAEFLGYSRTLDGGSGRLLETVLKYLESYGIPYSIGPAANGLLNARKASGQELQAAVNAGKVVHQTDLFDHPEVPGFKRTLKPYQLAAVAHMVAVNHSANFSVPGSGKTTMVLAAYAQIKESTGIEKILIVGPRSCFSPWEEEFESCFGRAPSSVRLSGTPLERAVHYDEASKPSTDLVLVTYQTATNDASQLGEFLRRHKTMMVLDESHYIKRLSGGVWSKALLDLAPYAAKRVILTGTPVPNGIEDIWSQMTFLWPEPPLLGARENFQDRVNRGGPDVTEEVRDELLPLFWRVKKSDVQLPPPEYHRISVPLKPYQSTIYRVLAAKVLSDIESRPAEREKLRQWRKAKIVRLLQAASNPSLLTEYSPEFKVPPLSASGLSVSEIIEGYSQFEVPAKIDFAVQLVQSILGKDASAKVIVWSAFVHNLETLALSLKAWEPRVIHGSVPKDVSEDAEFNRESLIRDFKTDAAYRLMLANPGACAESISLHRVCKHAIYMDRSFNGAQYMQSLDRIHRLGLEPTDKVHYYLLNATDTVDEVVDARLTDKHERLIRLLEGDLATVDLDIDDLSDEADEVGDFEAMVRQLRQQFDKTRLE